MPKLHLEDDAYLDRLVCCNGAVGECLGLVICDVPSFEAAQLKLKNGHWTTNAPVLATAFSGAFPWLLAAIASGQGQRCPVWEEFAEDLAGSEKYNDWIYRLTRRYLQQPLGPPLSKQQGGPKQSLRERAREEFLDVLTHMVYVLCGRAHHFQAQTRSQRARGNSQKTWLDIALYERRADPGRVIRAGRGQKQRLDPPRTAEANPPDPALSKPARATIGTDTDVFGAKGEATRPPDPPTDKDETPAAIAQTEERDARIRQVKAELSADQQRVLQYHIDDELSWDDTAAKMGRSVYKTQRLFKTATNQLRAKLAGV